MEGWGKGWVLVGSGRRCKNYVGIMELYGCEIEDGRREERKEKCAGWG